MSAAAKGTLLSDYEYELPPSLIAQSPCEPRDAARLLLMRRKSGALAHMRFHDFPHLLRAGDCLVLNDTRVYPARLRAEKIPGGGQVEILLLRRLGAARWRALCRGHRLRVGTNLRIQTDSLDLQAEIVLQAADGQRELLFDQPILSQLSDIGETPLPPYIHQRLRHAERYQTIYSRALGSAAAPTAGLHFTENTFTALAERQIQRAFCTLHIGLDTFQPVRNENIAKHRMHNEYAELNEAAIRIIQKTRESGGRILAIGTTTVRVLESAALAINDGELLAPFAGETSLFIHPGHPWRVVDALLTNFHLPRSSLLLMVSAFAGREALLRAYSAAIRARYRFYSLGDAMLIL